jgi:hypothetical protein
MSLLLWGMCAALSSVAGLFFWKFYREAHDRLFAMFAVSFWLLAAHWLALGVVNPATETRFYFYAPRLLAFLLIVAAIIDKNHAPARRTRPRS